LQTARQDNDGKCLRLHIVKQKITIYPPQYLPPFSWVGLTHAPESESGVAKPNKRKIANAICFFVARPPPNNDNIFLLKVFAMENILFLQL